MKPTMSVIYVPDTGHALAAVSRSADPSAPFDLAPLSDHALLVTNQTSNPGPSFVGEKYNVPYKVLASTKTPVPLEMDLMFTPLNYVVDNDVPQKAFSVPWSPPAAPPKLSSTTISVSLPPPLPQDVKVWVHVQEQSPADPANPEIRITSGKITQGTTAFPVDLPLTGSPGGIPTPLPSSSPARSYSVLVLVAGYPAYIATQNV